MFQKGLIFNGALFQFCHKQAPGHYESKIVICGCNRKITCPPRLKKEGLIVTANSSMIRANGRGTDLWNDPWLRGTILPRAGVSCAYCWDDLLTAAIHSSPELGPQFHSWFPLPSDPLYPQPTQAEPL